MLSLARTRASPLRNCNYAFSVLPLSERYDSNENLTTCIVTKRYIYRRALFWWGELLANVFRIACVKRSRFQRKMVENDPPNGD